MKYSVLFIAIIALVSCTKDMAPDPNCPTQISFSQDIVPILQNNCVSCHSGGTPPDLTTYASTSAAADMVLSRMSLANGDPSLMPQGGPRMADSIIQKIQCWIDQGKLDN